MSYVEPGDLLWQEIASVAESEGLRVYDIERQGADTLRVFVERNDQPEALPDSASPSELLRGDGGATSGDCHRLCRRLKLLFIAEFARLQLPDDVSLEVSTPGVNRRLRLPEHFRGAIGKRVKVILTAPISSPASGKLESVLTGPLVQASDSGIQVCLGDKVTQSEEAQCEGEIYDVSFDRIKRSQIDFRF